MLMCPDIFKLFHQEACHYAVPDTIIIGGKRRVVFPLSITETLGQLGSNLCCEAALLSDRL